MALLQNQLESNLGPQFSPPLSYKISGIKAAMRIHSMLELQQLNISNFSLKLKYLHILSNHTEFLVFTNHLTLKQNLVYHTMCCNVILISCSVHHISVYLFHSCPARFIYYSGQASVGLYTQRGMVLLVREVLRGSSRRTLFNILENI